MTSPKHPRRSPAQKKLSGAAPAAPVAAGPGAPLDHEDLVFSEITTRTVLYGNMLPGPNPNDPDVPDPDSLVTVTCAASLNPGYHDRHDRTLYTFTLKRATTKPENPAKFSLLTLGLQAAHHTVSIRSLRSSENDALIVDPAGNTQAPTLKQPVVVPPTDTKVVGNGPDKNPDADAIWFVQFSGAECRVEAFAVDRDELGVINWVGDSVGTGHDNTPPPSQPN